MKKLTISLLLLSVFCVSQLTQKSLANSIKYSPDEVSSWENKSKQVTIIRDKWGIPHIYGKTDADTVFGLMYAQAEDDFNRIEVNYLNAIGRLAEAEGEKEIFRDLRMRLFIEEGEMKRLFNQSPEWLQKLMKAYADGLNYYLYTHPDTQPMVIKRFEPWMALTFSEGSIGGDIVRVSINELENLYGTPKERKITEAQLDFDLEPRGSNGFAIAPSKTKNGNALLYINPHTSHYFRQEAHMVSEEGLNAYGALTWGQFFIYQGFNSKNGWMHTSNRADVIDEYVETIVEKNNEYFYLHDGKEKPLKKSIITISYKTDNGMNSKDFTVYHSHHGPIIREENGKWISVQMMNVPDTALNQSYTRTKTNNYNEYHDMMELKSNSSNNTIYADADGTIAYFHGNFHPIRDTSFDWNHPVDGTNPATDWKGLHSVDEAINAINPESNWLYNSNNWPFTLTDSEYSPQKKDYPSYMSVNFENPRGEHALRIFPDLKDMTIDSLITASYDSYLPIFAQMIPNLVAAYQGASIEIKTRTKEPVELLAEWDFRSSIDSKEMSLAAFWGNELWSLIPIKNDPFSVYEFLRNEVSGEQYLNALSSAVNKMNHDFGTWKIPYGEINRMQRISGDIIQVFDDKKPSTPVGMTSGRWGALASFGSQQFSNTKKMYGTNGNSFVAAVEFGERVKAKALLAGGINSNPASPHFDDQLEIYSTGVFRDVYYYKDDVEKNAERVYHPGE